MTECTPQQVEFSRLKRRSVSAAFDGGRMTSDAGVLLLREVDRQIGLIDAVNDCIPDPRDQRYVVHQQRDQLAQRIYGIALGYEDLNDQDSLRNDPGIQVAVGASTEESEPLASAPTLCRLENRVDRKAIVRLSEILVDHFLASHDSAPQEIILDVDATDDPVHGQQEFRFYHGYYRCHCYLPLYVFCGEHVLCALLRPSDIDPAKHSRAVLKLLVDRIRREWPDVRIIIRADSGFCRWKLMRWCDRNYVDYILGIGRNPALERLIDPLMQQAEAAWDETGDKQRWFAEAEYAAQSWDFERRLIMKAERLPAGPNRRFVITSLDGDPQELYDRLYCQRGEMENRIKEQQLMLFADRTSCHAFVANQFRLLLSSFAYVLLQSLREKHLVATDLRHAQVNTIRLKLFKIAAQVTISVRRIVFHLPSSYPYKRPFHTATVSLLNDYG